MTPLKVQAEVRYTAILDFRSVYRPIVSPYLKFCEFEISNPDTFNEFIVLKFKSEGIAIDLRWDRIILISDGKKENLFSINGPMSHYFSILNKLQELTSFGRINDYLLAEWSLLIMDLEELEILRKFREKYLSSAPLPSNEYDLEDVGIQLNFKEKENTIRFNFGPFRREHDIEAYKLKPISSREMKEMLAKNGIISQAISVVRANVVDIDIFRKMSIRSAQLNRGITL